MFSKRNDEEQSHWISFTDLVSGFMIVFIVVSLVALGQIKPEEKTKISIPDPKILEPDSTDTTPEGKYREIVDIFGKRLKGWEAVEIADSATIRFSVKSTSTSPLFRQNESRLTTYFRSILDRFIPIYLDELNKLYRQQESQSFAIREIRIEGHTDPLSDYLYNLELSSKRAFEVQKYILSHKEIKKYAGEFQKFMEEYSIACGYSFSRTLNDNGKRVDHRIRKEVNFDKSRRVEFRIILEQKSK